MWRAFRKSRSEIPPRVEDYPVLILYFLVLHLEPDFCFYCFLQGKLAAVVTLPVIPFKHCFGILFFFLHVPVCASVVHLSECACLGTCTCICVWTFILPFVCQQSNYVCVVCSCMRDSKPRSPTTECQKARLRERDRELSFKNIFALISVEQKRTRF